MKKGTHTFAQASDRRWQEVGVLQAGRRTDGEALARGIAIAEASQARLLVAFVSHPASTGYLHAAYARAGIPPQWVESDRQAILREALADIPSSLPVTTRRLHCGCFVAIGRLLDQHEQMLLVIGASRIDLVGPLAWLRRRHRQGRVVLVGGR